MDGAESICEDEGRRKPDIDEVIAALRRESRDGGLARSSAIIYGLSDLSDSELSHLAGEWHGLSAAFRHHILKRLVETSESVFELNFDGLALANLDDRSSLVRVAAVELLWANEELGTMERLLEMARDDDSAEVRAQAFSGLARFILLGEYGDIPAQKAEEAQSLALAVCKDRREPAEVRRRALEAIANSSHGEVESLIRGAYADGNHSMKLSAIYAMGRTCNTIWGELLLEELEGGDSQMVYEAVQACGSLQLEESVPIIGEMARDGDTETQLAAIWALGEIGGREAFEILRGLEESVEDSSVLEAVQEAIDSASFGLNFSPLGMA